MPAATKMTVTRISDVIWNAGRSPLPPSSVIGAGGTIVLLIQVVLDEIRV